MTQDILDNALDLNKLFVRLWEKKYRIISAALLGMLFALLYSKLAEQRWHSVARLDRSSLNQVVDYYQALQQLQILAAKQTDVPLDPEKLTSQIYQLVILNLQAKDTQKAFWSQPNLSARFRLENTNKEWQTLLNRIRFKPADPNKSTHDSIQLQADTPEKSQQFLQQYLQFVAIKTLTELNLDLQSKWQIALSGLNTQLQLQNSKFLHEKSDVGTQLNRAKLPSQQLKTKTNGVKKQQPHPKMSERPGIREQLIFDENGEGEIAELQARIKLITAHTPGFLSFPCWRFLQTPDKPVSNDNPPALILCLMWGFAAASLAATMVLLRPPKPSRISEE